MSGDLNNEETAGCRWLEGPMERCQLWPAAEACWFGAGEHKPEL